MTLRASGAPSPTGEGSVEPRLSPTGDGLLLSWLEPSAEGGSRLLASTLRDGSWAEPREVVRSDRLMVNWADLPAVTPGAEAGTLWAHWLEREGDGYGYGIRLARSDDGGVTWTGPWTPHEDGTDTEHGFAAAFPLGDGLGFLWLDGRGYAEGAAGASAAATALYFRRFGPAGPAGSEEVVEERVCDCCQTDVALTAGGPVVAFRGRSDAEIRDIHVLRWEDGGWAHPVLVHEDGWETGACPVNGPAVAARGDDVWVAWFTAAGGEARVKVARSGDGAARFDRPVVVDDGTPAGRVDVLALPDGSALVAWLEHAGDWPEVRVRHVDARGRAGPSLGVSDGAARATGVPSLALAPDGVPVLAWTDAAGPAPRVRLARVELDGAQVGARAMEGGA